MKTVEYEKLASVDVAPLELVCPARVEGGRGRYWRGVRHKDFVDAIKLELTKQRIAIESEEYVLSRDEADLLACFTAKQKVAGGGPLLIVAVNSNAMRYSPRLGVGVVVNDCPVLLCFEKMARHATHFDLSKEVAAVVDAMNFGEIAEWIGGYKREKLTAIDAVCMETARRKIIPWSKVVDLDCSLRKRTTATQWDYLQAVAKINKERSPMQLMFGSVKAAEIVK